MKTLHLNVKKQWFDMIASGFKKEEYREIKEYWINRFIKKEDLSNQNYSIIEFKNGYQKKSPTIIVEFNGIFVGKPKPEWSGNIFGKEIKDCFVIKLGKVLKKQDGEN